MNMGGRGSLPKPLKENEELNELDRATDGISGRVLRDLCYIAEWTWTSKVNRGK